MRKNIVILLNLGEKIMKVKNFLIRQRDNNKVAVKCNDEVMTYSQWYKLSKELAEKFNSKLDKSSKNIGIILPNSIDYCVAYFAILFSERVIVPISYDATSEELRNIIEFCEIDLLISNSDKLDFIQKVLSNYNYSVEIYDCFTAKFIIPFKNRGLISKSKIDIGDTVILLHTSGSTSAPKRVMLTNKNLVSNVESNIQSLKLSSEDKVLISLPILFGYSNTSQFLTHTYLGATIVIFNGLMLPRFLFSIIKKEGITNYTVVPSVINAILEDRKSLPIDLPNLRYICFGGGPISISKLNNFIQLFPKIGIVQTYGQTEASPRITALLPKYKVSKLGSVGKPIPNVEIKISSEEYEKCNSKQIGEILVKSSGVMRGYYKDQAATNATIVDGWLHTGDLGYFDEEGFLFITGRKKNIIISGGVNISAEEIESILLEHHNVKEVYVYSKSDDYLIEVPCADIVVYDEAIDNNFQQFCSERLSSLKVPREFNIVKELPKTYNGKIRRLK
ncbi:long-chain fatty acid--CoA ligase [Streptococcus anginosus]|nr:long-chain fatty acid--CoA ligase [Streptococcus anginosus]RGY84502.1 long-chain fatty acid--CoA ligase [Streptococcus anginosus]